MKINKPGKIIDINYLEALPVSDLEIQASGVEGIEILNIMHNGKEIDMISSHFAEIEIELYDEMIEQYYQLIAEQNQN